MNCLALNTDYVIRTGDFEPADAEKFAYQEIKRSGKNIIFSDNLESICMSKVLMSDNFVDDATEIQKKALARYESVRKGSEERLVSGSDDNTLIMWLPEKDKKPLSKRSCCVYFMFGL